jgi:outer membrane biosynthesis protein TonB
VTHDPFPIFGSFVRALALFGVLSVLLTVNTVAAQNLVGNPGFETNTSGWNSPTNITLTRVSGGHSGSFSAKLANAGTTATECNLNDSPNWVSTTSAGTYTGSIWARADTAGAMLKLRFREYNNSGGAFVGSNTATITLSTSWQQVTVTYVPGAAGSSNLDFNAYVSSAPVGTCFYADDASITLSGIATPTATATSPPATPTPTRTPTSVPPTPTRTSTPVPPPPTATSTPVPPPTATPTAIPPSPTPTRTPTSAPATATPTRTPTSPPATATPTYTPTPSAATPTPTATRTSTPLVTATPTPPVGTTPTPVNLVGNPGFETNTSGWAGAGTGTTLARVSGGHSGSFSAKLANGGTSATECNLNDSPNWVATTSAGTYTGSIWAKADTAGAVLKLRFREYSNGNGSNLGSNTASLTLSTAWQQLTLSYVPTAPGSSNLDFNAYESNAPVGTCFYADDASITLSAATTPTPTPTAIATSTPTRTPTSPSGPTPTFTPVPPTPTATSAPMRTPTPLSTPIPLPTGSRSYQTDSFHRLTGAPGETFNYDRTGNRLNAN